MVDKNDWRLTNQNNYLKDVKLIHTQYFNDISNKDHNHCKFCWKKFMNEGQYGYCILNKYYWICKECYTDFNKMFEWEVLNELDKKEK